MLYISSAYQGSLNTARLVATHYFPFKSLIVTNLFYLEFSLSLCLYSNVETYSTLLFGLNEQSIGIVAVCRYMRSRQLN